MPTPAPPVTGRATLAAVDGYLRKNARWSDALSLLRELILAQGLTETVKWRTPCYTHNETNVLFIGAHTDFCVLSFLQGVLLKDPKGMLELLGENTRAARVMRFTSVAEVQKQRAGITGLIKEAKALAATGTKYNYKADAPPELPEELSAAFAEMPELKTAFGALTPGRQRAYILHFTGAKQSATRTARIEKATPAILGGKGLDDAYQSKMKAKPKAKPKSSKPG